MSIQLAAPESVVRTKADIVFIGFNFVTRIASIGFLVTQADGSDPREVQKQIDPARFSAFVQACGLTRNAVEQFIASNFIPGTVT